MRTDEKLREKWGKLQSGRAPREGKKPTSLSIVFYGLQQELYKDWDYCYWGWFVLWNCYGLTQWRVPMFYACPPDPTREMVMYFHTLATQSDVSLTQILQVTNLIVCYWSLGWHWFSPSIQVFQVLLIRLSFVPVFRSSHVPKK